MLAVQHHTEGIADKNTAYAVYRSIMYPLQHRAINSGASAIKAGGSAVVKTVSTVLFVFNRLFVKMAAGDNAAIPALPVLPTAQANVCVFTLDNAGNKAALLGVPAATVGAIIPPVIPKGQVPYGMILIENATGSNFTGGATALDTGSLTVTYVDIVGQIDFDAITL